MVPAVLLDAIEQAGVPGEGVESIHSRQTDD